MRTFIAGVQFNNARVLDCFESHYVKRHREKVCRLWSRGTPDGADQKGAQLCKFAGENS